MKKALCLIMALAMILSLSVTAFADWATDKTITVVQSSDVFVFDPTASADVNNKNCLKNVLSRLYETDEYFNPVPTLATEYTQSEDGLTWTFTIAEAKFFDGTPVTVNDIIKSFEHVKANKCSGQTLLKPVVEMREEDGKLVLVTDHVYGSMLTALSNSACAILSANWIEKAEKGECTWEDVVRNGACGRYKIENREPGISCTLVANPDYFDQNDAAQNDRIIFRVIPEATTRTIMVQTGEADLDVNFDTAAMDQCKADSNVEILEMESSKVYEMWLNVEKLPKNVRQAIAYAVNREDCLEIGANGYGQIWTNCWAPYVKGAAADHSSYTYDPDKALELLAGTTMDITACVTTDEEERVAQIVQLYLMNVGLNLTITRIDKSVLSSEMGSGNYDIAFASSTFYDDPELFFERQYGEAGIGVGNYSHYTSDECMELLTKANATLDPDFRLDCYNQINKIVMDDACVIGLYNSTLFDLQRAGLQGVQMNVETTYGFHTIHY